MSDFASPSKPGKLELPKGVKVVRLTVRQVEILVHIANGESTKEIGAALGISPKTVATHRSNIMRELSIREVAGLVRYAVRYRLIDP